MSAVALPWSMRRVRRAGVEGRSVQCDRGMICACGGRAADGVEPRDTLVDLRNDVTGKRAKMDIDRHQENDVTQRSRVVASAVHERAPEHVACPRHGVDDM